MNATPTGATGSGGHREQEFYWGQLVELKALSFVVRRYRDDQAWWVRCIGIIKALATSGTIAGWAIWKDYAFVWGIILALSQLLDALKDFIPQAKHLQNASELLAVVEAMFIDARFEWNAIYNGLVPAPEIMAKWQKLAKMQLEAERKYFPDGISLPKNEEALALQDAKAYFKATYGVGA